MNATVTPPVTTGTQGEPPEPARRHPGVRLAALLVGAGVAIVCAATLHVAVAVGLLMLAGILVVGDGGRQDRGRGRGRLDDAGFPPAPSFTGEEPTWR